MHLATMRGGCVERDLMDTGLVVWTVDDIDRAIRRALWEYSQSLPYRADRTVTISTAGREQSLSALTGLLAVERIWWPYYADQPDRTPAYGRADNQAAMAHRSELRALWERVRVEIVAESRGALVNQGGTGSEGAQTTLRGRALSP